MNGSPRRNGNRATLVCGAWARPGRRGLPSTLDTNRGHTISAKLFVGNLNFSTTQTELETLFATVGEVEEVFLPVDRSTGQPRGFAFVTLADPSLIPEAISRFDGSELQGRPLRVNQAQDRPPQSSGGFRSPSDAGARFKGNKPKGSRRGIRGRKRGF